MVEELTFQSNHFELVGDLQLPVGDLQRPVGEGKYPVIVMVHGDGDIDRYDRGKYRPIMERFLRAGYAVFSYDKPGSGESTGEFADGAWIITDRATILTDAIRFLKEHPAIDPQRIGVWGISQGGIVIPMALTMSDDIAFAIVVSGPGVNGIDQTAYLIGQKLLCEGYSEEEAKLAEQSFAGLCKATTYQEYRESKTSLVQFPSALIFTGRDILPEEEWQPWDRQVDAFFNPADVIESATIPVLAVFGDRDRQVDPFQGAQAYEQALQQAGNRYFHVELVPGTDHNIVLSETGCMSERDRRSRADWLKYAPEYLDLMEEWLRNLPSPSVRLSNLPVASILAQLEGLPLDQFLEESFRQLQLRDPDALFFNGFADAYGIVPGERFTDLSAEYIQETQFLEREILALLQAYDRDALSADQKISYDALEWYLTTRVRGQAFTGYKFLVNPVWGLQNLPTEFLLEVQPLANKQDAESYIARISNLDVWAAQVVAGLERNEQVGAIPPRYVLEDTIDLLDDILVIRGGNPPAAEQIEVYTHFRSKVKWIDGLGEEEKAALLDAARQAVEGAFIPAFQAIRDQLAHLATVAVADPDLWQLPGGEEYYDYLLAYYTGTDLSADEIHEMGRAEVARIQAEIGEVLAELGYPADMSMAELNQLLADESPVLTGEPLRRKYEEILAAVDEAAADYFDLRPSAGVVILPVSSGPPAYYQPPELGSPGPGTMPANLDFSPLVVNYNEHVLVHHETIPGHHTQVALAQELDLPAYQRFYGSNPFFQVYDFQAYAEGWALYAEVLAWEMGLYEDDPLANLGRLRQRLIRTARIVADTGLYAQGWTLEDVGDYLEETTGISQTNAQLTRYIVNPGYPCGYNVGGLKILEMRQRAMDALGDRFDIKEFHNVVLGHGVLPINVLEKVVDDWIEQELEGVPGN